MNIPIEDFSTALELVICNYNHNLKLGWTKKLAREQIYHDWLKLAIDETCITIEDAYKDLEPSLRFIGII